VISFGPEVRVFVATQPIDFRKGVHGLVALVAEGLAGEPYSGDVFVFRSKRSDRLKLLVFDGSGLILATKWLEEGDDAGDGDATGDADRRSVGVVAVCPEGDEAAGESRLSRLVLLATPGAFV
jgi:transposase